MGALPDVLECGIQNALAAWHVTKFDAKHFFSFFKRPCLVSIVRNELWWQFIALGKHLKSISSIYPDSGNMRQLSTQSMSQKSLPTQPHPDNQVQMHIYLVGLFHYFMPNILQKNSCPLLHLQLSHLQQMTFFIP